MFKKNAQIATSLDRIATALERIADQPTRVSYAQQICAADAAVAEHFAALNATLARSVAAGVNRAQRTAR